MQYRKYRMVFVIFMMFLALLMGCGRTTADAQISLSRSEMVEMALCGFGTK